MIKRIALGVTALLGRRIVGSLLRRLVRRLFRR